MTHGIRSRNIFYFKAINKNDTFWRSGILSLGAMYTLPSHLVRLSHFDFPVTLEWGKLVSVSLHVALFKWRTKSETRFFFSRVRVCILRFSTSVEKEPIRHCRVQMAHYLSSPSITSVCISSPAEFKRSKRLNIEGKRGLLYGHPRGIDPWITVTLWLENLQRQHSPTTGMN